MGKEIQDANHSCYPNCGIIHPGAPPDEEIPVPGFLPVVPKRRNTRLKAITNIAPGEELTVSYFGARFALECATAEARRDRLQFGFEFHCSCVLCEPGEAGPPTHGQLCKRAICWGKPPPLPP